MEFGSRPCVTLVRQRFQCGPKAADEVGCCATKRDVTDVGYLVNAVSLKYVTRGSGVLVVRRGTSLSDLEAQLSETWLCKLHS
jgi:hypothetical protein